MNLELTTLFPQNCSECGNTTSEWKLGRQRAEKRHRKCKTEPLYVAAGFHLDFQNCAAASSESQQTNQIPQCVVYWLHFYSAWKTLIELTGMGGFATTSEWQYRTLEHFSTPRKMLKMLSCLFPWSAIAKPMIAFLTVMRNFDVGQEYETLKAMVNALSLWQKHKMEWSNLCCFM